MQFIMNTWYAAAWGSEVSPKTPVARTIADLPMVLYRQTDGTPVVLEDRCSHRCAPLSKGRVEGDDLRCWYHGLRFGPRGQCLEMPGQELVAGFDVRSYPVVEQDECLWVWTGDPALADRAAIPVARLSENGIKFVTGALDYASDYQLINDNLCDFSHVSYVHERTLGGGNNEWANTLPKLSNLDNGFRSTRWLEGAGLYPLPGFESKPRDQWTTYDYLVPGVLVMQMDFYPVGTARRLGFAPPPASMEGADHVLRSLQMATPTTTNRCRYLFSLSHPVDPSPDAMHAAMEIQKLAFAEDKDMIESQQATIDLNPGIVLRNTKHDKGLVRIRNLIAARKKQEERAERMPAAAE